MCVFCVFDKERISFPFLYIRKECQQSHAYAIKYAIQCNLAVNFVHKRVRVQFL